MFSPFFIQNLRSFSLMVYFALEVTEYAFDYRRQSEQELRSGGYL